MITQVDKVINDLNGGLSDRSAINAKRLAALQASAAERADGAGKRLQATLKSLEALSGALNTALTNRTAGAEGRMQQFEKVLETLQTSVGDRTEGSEKRLEEVITQVDKVVALLNVALADRMAVWDAYNKDRAQFAQARTKESAELQTLFKSMSDFADEDERATKAGTPIAPAIRKKRIEDFAKNLTEIEGRIDAIQKAVPFPPFAATRAFFSNLHEQVAKNAENRDKVAQDAVLLLFERLDKAFASSEARAPEVREEDSKTIWQWIGDLLPSLPQADREAAEKYRREVEEVSKNAQESAKQQQSLEEQRETGRKLLERLQKTNP